jgi:hypothetical protein
LRPRAGTEPGGRVEIAGLDEILTKRSVGKRYIFFSAHCGNWEIASRAALQAGFGIAGVYRAANNPIIDRLLARMRGDAELIPKGAIGACRAIAWLKAGNHLSMLIDASSTISPFQATLGGVSAALARFCASSWRSKATASSARPASLAARSGTPPVRTSVILIASIAAETNARMSLTDNNAGSSSISLAASRQACASFVSAVTRSNCSCTAASRNRATSAAPTYSSCAAAVACHRSRRDQTASVANEGGFLVRISS